jgi:hypothetical protein
MTMIDPDNCFVYTNTYNGMFVLSNEKLCLLCGKPSEQDEHQECIDYEKSFDCLGNSQEATR